jgi:hypothetical protein
MGESEVLLHGGYTNAGHVRRVGDTVRRPWRPTSRATKALLDHLAKVGFDGAPRFLGIDSDGREMLSFIPGDAAIEPYQNWALTDEALVSVALLLRRLHDAVASFDPSGHQWPQPVPRRFRDGTISHNDPNLDNVVFRDGRAVALIDFDLASHGSAVWDVACAVRLWAPLRAEQDMPTMLRGRALERLRLFTDAYGVAAQERERLVSAFVDAHEWCYRIVSSAVRDGHQPFSRMWHHGGESFAARTRTWLQAHDHAMRAAVVDSADNPRKPISNE